MGSGSAFECPEGLAETKQETNVMQKLGYSAANTVNSFSSGSPIGVEGVPDQFPAGLRILVVDDDPTCLKILERMLRRCMYEVTTCCRARVALSILRERKGGFDLVISDVYMPDMDGFKLLEHVGLEMDLPVIMMSADGETSVVMKGIKHGACDYLIKPVRIEALKTIWQHVIRKKRNESKELEHSGSVEDSDKHKKGLDDVEYASSVNEGTNGNCKHSRKRKENDEDGEQDNDDSSTLKKPRVVWSVELHQQFVCAVNQLGIDKAVPKRILELMNVQGLTRENVASHLQKYRLYLRRLSGVAQQQSGLNPSFGGPMEANFGSIASLERLDLQAIVASGQISRQTLAAFQAGLIGSVNANNGLGMPGIDLAFLLQQELQGANCNPQDRVRFRQPLLNNQGNLLQSLPTGLELKQLAQSQQHIPSFENAGFSVDDTSAGFPLVQQKVVTASAGLGDVGQMSEMSNNAALNPHNNPLMVQMIQQQQERPLHQHQQQILTSTAQQQQPCAQFQGERLEGGQVLNLPSASILGLQVFSNGIGGRANPVPSLGNSSTGKGNPIVGASCSGQVNCVPMPAQGLGLAASSASVGIGRTPTVDYQNHYLPIMSGNNHSLPGTVGASTPLPSIGTGGDLSMAGMGSLGGMSDTVVSQTLRRPDSNSGAFSVFGQSLSQSSKQGWHVPNLALNADTSQTGSSVPNSHGSQGFSATQGLNIPGIQDEGHVRNFGFVGKGLCLPSRLSDAEHTRAVKNVQCQSEHSVDSGPRLKTEGASDLVASSKFEGGLLSEQFSQDDLMSLLFKQQQQGVGLAEGEFNIDGYQLDNIHVK